MALRFRSTIARHVLQTHGILGFRDGAREKSGGKEEAGLRVLSTLFNLLKTRSKKAGKEREKAMPHPNPISSHPIPSFVSKRTGPWRLLRRD